MRQAKMNKARFELESSSGHAVEMLGQQAFDQTASGFDGVTGG